jgi:hypothetical protein
VTNVTSIAVKAIHSFFMQPLCPAGEVGAGGDRRHL